MKLKTIMKTIGTFVNRSKTQIVKHSPQIMAVAGVGCFIAGTYCAIKETPKAMAKLEAKKALDPDMGKLQTVAVVAPEYKKTLACTAAGITFTGLAWHLEAKYVATLLAGLSKLDLENKNLIEASKKVVGEEKTGEILAKKEELAAEDAEIEAHAERPGDDIPYPFLFPGGAEIWMTWSQYRERLDRCVRRLSTSHQMKESEYFSIMGLDEKKITKGMEKRGWQPSAGAVASCDDDPSAWLQWAYETMAYDSEAYDYDHYYRHIAGWNIEWRVDTEKWDPNLME